MTVPTARFRDLPVTANLFAAGTDAIVNPVNCVGVMGKGLALEFKQRFPANFEIYRRACQQHQLRPGSILVHELDLAERALAGGTRWVVNLATKDHWRNPSQLAWIESGTAALRQWAESNPVTAIALPAIGAGLGGLDWPSVRQVILRQFANSPVELLLHHPHPGSRPGIATPFRQRP